VTFWAGDILPERNEIWNKIVKDFESTNPSIKIDYLGIPGKPFEKLEVALAAGIPPNICEPGFNAGLIGRDLLEPLDEYFDKSPIKSAITEGAIQSIRNFDGREGKLYAIPDRVLMDCLWVRTDWFEAAGIPIPDTWDDFYNAADKLTNKEQDRYGYTIRGGIGNAWTLEYQCYSYSGIGSLFDDMGKCTINDPLHVEFVEQHLGRYNITTPEADITNGWDKMIETFQSGRCAMLHHNLAAGPLIDETVGEYGTKFDALPLPKSKKGYPVWKTMTPNAYPIFKDSKNKDAAFKFIEFIVGKEQNELISEAYGFLPLNKENANAEWLNERPYMLEGAKWLNDPTSHFYNRHLYIPEKKSIEDQYVYHNIQKVMLKEMSAEDMLNDWASRTEKAKIDFDASVNK
jgi:multiple sugar transport system substrate-binding protein